MPKSSTGRQILAALPREGSTAQCWIVPLCCSEGSAAAGARSPLPGWAQSSEYPFSMGSPAFLAWLLPPLQRDTQSFAVVPVICMQGSVAKRCCERCPLLAAPGLLFILLCLLLLGDKNPQLCREMQTPVCRR